MKKLPPLLLMSGLVYAAAWAVAAAPVRADVPQQAAVPTLPAGAAPGRSPVTVSDFKRPQFDTTTPVYDPVRGFGKAANTIVAEVDGRAITLGDVADEMRALPDAMQNQPFETLYGAVIDTLVRQQALVIMAQRAGLDEDPVVKRRMKAASEQVLQNAILHHETEAAITEQALLERYKRDVAGRPGPDEVHARVILVPTEDAARTVIGELNGGADFGAVAVRVSKDASARMGGDLGFVRRGALAPNVSTTLFLLDPGKVAQAPVQGPGGWLVLKSDARRRAATPTFGEARTGLLQELAREGVGAVSRKAMTGATVRIYSISGREAPQPQVNDQDSQNKP